MFNAASGQQEAVGDFSQAVHRAVVKVPDERVVKLAELVRPKKSTFAEIEFLDAPGITGKGKEAGEFELNPEIRKMEALMVVIDAFSPDADPRRDIQDIIDEMILADHVMFETILDKKARKMQLTGDKSLQREVDLVKRCSEALEQETPLIDLEFTAEEDKALRSYQPVTQKPQLIVLNIGEDDLGKVAGIREKYADFVQPARRELAVVCGKIEAELVALDDDERSQFMAELGIETPAVEKVIQRSYDLLGLISFLTAGEPEVRAWTVRKGTIAHKAAGAIHSDIERGFIRAEVTPFADYVEYKTPAALKAAGKSRLEGKEYVVQDGDVILFRFNV